MTAAPDGGGVALVVNPVGRGTRAAVDAVRAACRDAGQGEPLVLDTSLDDPGPGQAARALEAGAERVVVAGGDGTVRLVSRALADAGRPVTLGVVPAGTANLFARSAGLPRHDLRAAARRAVTAPGRPTDLGHAQVRDADGRVGEHPFLVVAGLGHDAATLAAVAGQAKRHLRWLAYLLPGLRRLGHAGHGLRLTLDGEPLETGPLWSLLAVNSARLPGPARVVPGARLDDGTLHAVLVSPRGVRGWARVAATGLRPAAGPPGDHPALRYRDARSLEVTSATPVPAQVDGDLLGDIVGARVTVRPGALLVAR